MSQATLRSSRARVILGSACVCFVLGQVATRLVVDHGTLTWRFTDAVAVLQQADEMGPDLDILLLGSSRLGSFMHGGAFLDGFAAESGRRPAILTAVVSASDATVMEEMFAELLARGRRPAMVVVEVSAEQLNHPARWLDVQMDRLLTCPAMIRSLLEVLDTGEFERLLYGCAMPSYAHRRALLTHFVGSAPPYLVMPPPPPRPNEGSATQTSIDVGPEPNPPWPATVAALDLVGPIHDPDAPSVRAAAQRESDWVSMSLQTFEADGIADRALHGIVEKARALGVAVVLLRTPVGSTLRAYYRDPVEAQFLEHLEARTAVPGTTFVDLADVLPDRHFVDVHHGTRAAAGYISYMLGRRLAPLLPASPE